MSRKLSSLSGGIKTVTLSASVGSIFGGLAAYAASSSDPSWFYELVLWLPLYAAGMLGIETKVGIFISALLYYGVITGFLLPFAFRKKWKSLMLASAVILLAHIAISRLTAHNVFSWGQKASEAIKGQTM